MKVYVIYRKYKRKPDKVLFKTTDSWKAGYALQDLQREYPKYDIQLKVLENEQI